MSRASQRTLDVALAAVVLVVTVSEALISTTVTGPRWAAVAACAGMSVLLLWRRSHPVRAAALLVVIAVPFSRLADPSALVTSFVPLLILAYSGGAYAEPRDARIALGLLVAGVVAVGLIGAEASASNAYFPAIVVLLCWLVGTTVRTRARHAAELHEAAALAAERREREAAEAVAGERRRIAREMHDVVAHSISLMVVQAGGARRILATDPARAQHAAAAIRTAGTEALAEMGILLGVLETAPDGAAPPTLDALGALVERTRAAGLPVTLEVTGTRRALGAGAELAVYRVVQEALTNAIKHAGRATTVVRLTWGDDELELSVADRGDGGPSPQLAGAGHGLIGMRERLRVFGGDVESGPRPEGGFAVSARLPIGTSLNTAPVPRPSATAITGRRAPRTPRPPASTG